MVVKAGEQYDCFFCKEEFVESGYLVNENLLDCPCGTSSEEFVTVKTCDSCLQGRGYILENETWVHPHATN